MPRDLVEYNRKMRLKKQPTLPNIVIMIDELADLMMTAPDQTEHSLIRLAQNGQSHRNSPGGCHAASEHRCGYRLDQSKFPGAYLLFGSFGCRFAGGAGYEWSRNLARQRGYAAARPTKKGFYNERRGVMVSDREIEKSSQSLAKDYTKRKQRGSMGSHDGNP